MYFSLRIDSDPTTWELTQGLEQPPTFDAKQPLVLSVYHPLKGHLVLSPRSVGSVCSLTIGIPSIFTALAPTASRLPSQSSRRCTFRRRQARTSRAFRRTSTSHWRT